MRDASDLRQFTALFRPLTPKLEDFGSDSDPPYRWAEPQNAPQKAHLAGCVQLQFKFFAMAEDRAEGITTVHMHFIF
jgi:hypothetical protein